MAGPSPDMYRLRLEGRAELLEAARSRYQELLEALRAPAWEELLRGKVATLRQVDAEQEQVDAALAMALRRAGAEGWPEQSPTVRLLHDVRARRDTLWRTAAERLGGRGGGDRLMPALEDHVRCAPRAVAPARRWAVALEVLPEDLPLLRDVSAFGALLRALFPEPFDPVQPPAFPAGQLEALRQLWPAGEAALSKCWSRLSEVDPSGGVVGEVRRRTGREPLHAPRSGPEQLALAEYWFTTAQERLEALVRERLALRPPARTEWREVALWLCEGGSRLRASASVTEERAGLFELAHALWEAGQSGDAPWPESRWERLLESARRAGPEGRTADASRCRDVLRTFILARSLGTSLVRGWREPEALEALVWQAREVAHAWDGG